MVCKEEEIRTPPLKTFLDIGASAMWGLAPDSPGTGMAALGYATRHINRVGRPQGGSGSLTDSIKASFEAATIPAPG